MKLEELFSVLSDYQYLFIYDRYGNDLGNYDKRNSIDLKYAECSVVNITARENIFDITLDVCE